MKKIIAIVTVFSLLLALAGCGNMSIGIGNFTFKKVHIDTYHYSGCLSVKKWYEADAGIEILTEDELSLFLSEGTYFLVGDECPICKEAEK